MTSGPDPLPDALTPEDSPGRLERFRVRVTARVARSWDVWALQILLVVVLILGWEFSAGRPSEGALIDEFYVGHPSEIWDKLVEWTRDGTLWDNSIVTLRETIIGFCLGCFFGTAVGFLLGIGRRASRVLYPFVMGFNAIPRLALAPLFLLWFGLGEQSKIALVVVIIFFLVFFSTYSGVRQVDHDLIDVMRVLGAKSWEIHAKVTLPSAMTWVVAGLRISVPYAFVAAVVGEMIAAQKGLGMLIQRSAQAFSPSSMFAAITALVVMSLCLNALVGVFERTVLRWQTYGSQPASFGT